MRAQILHRLARCLWAGALAAALSASAHAADDASTLRATLPNGLRVILVRNTLAPVVATSVNYLVGSDEAPAGFPGTAHAQEHMMFRGSPGLSADQLADIGSVMGGNFNANTRESLTQYLFTVPAEDLDVALHIESTRMRAVLDTAKDWDQERGASRIRATCCMRSCAEACLPVRPMRTMRLARGHPSMPRTSTCCASSTMPGTCRTTRY
jgi:hypothetical protein